MLKLCYIIDNKAKTEKDQIVKENVSRRAFLSGTVAASVAAMVPARASAAATVAAKPANYSDKGKVSFLAFADMHFRPGLWPFGIERLNAVLARAEKEKTDFTIQLGDFIHRANEQTEIEYVKRYNSFSQPTYHVLGNHDGEVGGLEMTFKLYNIKNPYYFFDRNGYRFIVGDPNYFLEKGADTPTHYEYYNFAKAQRRGSVEKGCLIPKEQVEWIRQTVEESPFPCVFFSHESIERKFSVVNAPEIRGIFEEANRRVPGKVRLVVNGHDHLDHVCVINDIVYFSMNSASYYYYSETHDAYPKDFVKGSFGVSHAIVWTDPLSAVVSLDSDGVRIVGSSSTYYLGIDPKKAGLPTYHILKRPVTPMIATFEYTKKYS